MPVGCFRLAIWRDGCLVSAINEPNMIVNGYATAIAALLAGSGTALTNIGYGTSTTPPAFGNAGLTGAFTKAIDGASVNGPGMLNSLPVVASATFRFSLAGTEANGLSIGEFGLFTTAGLLVARKARLAAPILKDATLSFSGTWTIGFPGS